MPRKAWAWCVRHAGAAPGEPSALEDGRGAECRVAAVAGASDGGHGPGVNINLIKHCCFFG